MTYFYVMAELKREMELARVTNLDMRILMTLRKLGANTPAQARALTDHQLQAAGLSMSVIETVRAQLQKVP